MTSLVDGRSQNQTSCVRADAMRPGTPPTLYPSDVCSDPVPTPLPESSGGCSVGGNTTSSSVLLLFAALLMMRRRRR
jgi:uncharacterized protein (TIGR03382 family)